MIADNVQDQGGMTDGRWHIVLAYQHGDYDYICQCTDGRHVDMVGLDAILADHERVQALERALEEIAGHAGSADHQGSCLAFVQAIAMRALTASPAQPTGDSND